MQRDATLNFARAPLVLLPLTLLSCDGPRPPDIPCVRYADAEVASSTPRSAKCTPEGLLTITVGYAKLSYEDGTPCRRRLEQDIRAYMSMGLNPRTDNQAIQYHCRQEGTSSSITNNVKHHTGPVMFGFGYNPATDSVTRLCEPSYSFRDMDATRVVLLPASQAARLRDVKSQKFGGKRYRPLGTAPELPSDCAGPPSARTPASL